MSLRTGSTTRNSTFTSNAMATPTYTTVTNDPVTKRISDHDERVSEWSASLPSTPDVDSGTLFEEPTDSDSVNKPCTDTTTRYIYYRLYTEDGALSSLNPVYSDDPYMGRIAAELVAPPHTVLSLKRCLSAVEHIMDGASTTELFVTASNPRPLGDTDHMSILAHTGPGCTPNKPMALVVISSGASVNRGQLEPTYTGTDLLPRPDGLTPFKTQYLYYRVYKPTGAVLSRKPVDSNKPFVGRISVDSVPPPHTAASIMRCIFKIEEHPGFRPSQLCINISSESPIGEKHVSILTGNRPGSTPGNPMAFVIGELPQFTKRQRVTHALTPAPKNPTWLATTVGEILHTANELAQYHQYVDLDGNPRAWLACEAINSTGKIGFVQPSAVKSSSHIK